MTASCCSARSFLHDSGLYDPASTGDVYIKDSARYARRTLEPFGWSDERVAGMSGRL